jgi:hypothetical protein
MLTERNEAADSAKVAGLSEEQEKRLEQLPVMYWSTSDVTNWMNSLAGQWEDHSAQLSKASAAMTTFNISGKELALFESASWDSVGATDAILQTRLRTKLGECETPEAYSKKSARLTSPVRLGVAINVLNISGIDTVAQTFDCEFVLRCRTLNIQRDSIKTVTGESVNSQNWEPRIRFMNLLSTTKWNFNSTLAKNGELHLKYTVAGTFAEAYELERFPFDRQGLTIAMSSSIPYEVETDQGPKRILSFEEMPRSISSKPFVVQTDNFQASNVYCLEPTVKFESSHTAREASTTGTTRPLLKFEMSVKRYAGSYVWNIILPLMLITLMSLGAFAVPFEDVADRLSVSMTMVLTAVAFKLQISQDIPKVHSPTTLDWYVLASFFVIFAVVAENVFIGLLLSDMDISPDQLESLDVMTRSVMFVVYVLVNIGFVIWFWKLWRLSRGGKVDDKPRDSVVPDTPDQPLLSSQF